jgi:hypothetical protein
VPGCIDDIDAVILPVYRRVLREDRNAALALQVTGVHHPVGHGSTRPEGPGLLQELIDQRGFAVVDVGNDRDVSQSFDI